MILRKITIEEFRKVIYPEYKKLFPKEERKPYKLIKKSFENNITDIIEIIESDEIVGFFIINALRNNQYAILDFFAILPQYQSKGYGSKAINLLKEENKDLGGIIIEIEKCGLGRNVEENSLREKRARFYERLGFQKMGFDVELYKVMYSIYVLPCNETRFFEDIKVSQAMFDIYKAISGEGRTKKNCKIYTEKKAR